jgi:hypothetical protein
MDGMRTADDKKQPQMNADERRYAERRGPRSGFGRHAGVAELPCRGVINVHLRSSAVASSLLHLYRERDGVT